MRVSTKPCCVLVLACVCVQLNANQLREKEKQERSARDKRKARAVEDERASKVASRPTHTDQPLIMVQGGVQGYRVASGPAHIR
jgi:hypothetical protein